MNKEFWKVVLTYWGGILIRKLESINKELRLSMSQRQVEMDKKVIAFTKSILDAKNKKSTIKSELIDIRRNALFVQYRLDSLLTKNKEEHISELFKNSQNVCTQLENIILQLNQE